MRHKLWNGPSKNRLSSSQGVMWSHTTAATALPSFMHSAHSGSLVSWALARFCQRAVRYSGLLFHVVLLFAVPFFVALHPRSHTPFVRLPPQPGVLHTVGGALGMALLSACN